MLQPSDSSQFSSSAAGPPDQPSGQTVESSYAHDQQQAQQYPYQQQQYGGHVAPQQHTHQGYPGTGFPVEQPGYSVQGTYIHTCNVLFR